MKRLTSRNTVSRQLGKTLCLTAMLAALLIMTPIVPAAVQTPQTAQQETQLTFASPAEAVDAMVSAAKNRDAEKLRQIFGPQVNEIVYSGDPVADKNDREKVLEKFDEMHRLVVEPNKSVTLYLGAENWPFPIPLVQKNGRWMFDTAAGKKEILFRRIGRNERSTIDTLTALVDAEKEYASAPQTGSTKEYAQKIISDEGKHDGLFWKTDPGEPESPIGPLIANAAGEGYTKSKEGPTPFHGYIYRVLQSQGSGAPGGAMSYMANGKMTRGFAFIAYPASYRNSGVMTFIVGKDGRIYQKDLGPRTEEIAKGMTHFNPDKTWSPAS
jgi:hypothetical protein